MRNPIHQILGLVLLITAFMPGPVENELIWDESKLLTWEDFRGAPNVLAHGDAAAAVSIRAIPTRRNNRLDYDVSAVFLRNDSWHKSTSKELLQHEQLHFDIAELYARKIRKEIVQLKRDKVRDPKVFHAAISALLEESNEADAMYDRETVHGAVRKRQLHWEFQVRTELKLLNRYAKVK